MFERFTEQARRVVVLAREEAERLGHDHIGTEHLLLGIISERDSAAAAALIHQEIDLDAVRVDVEKETGAGTGTTSEQPPFTPRAKKALEQSLREAVRLGHREIGSEHLLLGLMGDPESGAARVLIRHEVDLEALRSTVIAGKHDPGLESRSGRRHLLRGHQDSPPPPATPDFPACVRCGADLTEHTSIATVSARHGEGTLQMSLVYCGGCGGALGVTAPER